MRIGDGAAPFSGRWLCLRCGQEVLDAAAIREECPETILQQYKPYVGAFDDRQIAKMRNTVIEIVHAVRYLETHREGIWPGCLRSFGRQLLAAARVFSDADVADEARDLEAFIAKVQRMKETREHAELDFLIQNP